MKTLDQIEPRIPANDLPGDTEWSIIIDEPGSYYLTGNVKGVWGKGGIYISARDVTLDLNGFVVDGANVGERETGIYAWGERSFILNGSVTNWPGVALATRDHATISRIHASTQYENDWPGAGIATGAFANVKDCRVTRSHGVGFNIGVGSVVENCIASECDSDGFRATVSSLGAVVNATRITNSTAYQCEEYGFKASHSSVFTGCVSIQNQTAGFVVYAAGILANCSSLNDRTGYDLGLNSTATNCVAFASYDDAFVCEWGVKLYQCSVVSSQKNGFVLNGHPFYENNQCIECTAISCNGAGFLIDLSKSTLIGCQSTNNAIAIEIASTATGSIIDSCIISDNESGIQCDADSSVIRNNTLDSLTVTGANNLIINNTIAGGAKAVTIAPGNKNAAIVDHPDDAGPLSNIAL